MIRISAMWCMSCLIMLSRLDDLQTTYNLEFEDYDYDFDDITQFDVGDTLPVVLLMDKNNSICEKIVGEVSKKDLKSLLDKYQ